MPFFGRFLVRIKERRLFRVAGGYLIGGWLVVEVAATVFEILELPGWAAKLVLLLVVLGFPIALGVAWAYGVTIEDGPRVEDGTSRPPFRLPTRALFGIGATLALVGGSWVLLGPEPFAPAAASPSAVVVLPFDVRGGDEVAYLEDGGMVSLLAANLEGAGGLWSVDPKAVLATVGSGWDGRDPDAREVARGLGAAYYVTGDVVQAGSQVRMTARLQPIDEGAPLRASAEGSVAAPLAVIDRLTAELLAERSVGYQGGLAEVTTRSLPAIKHYLAGQEALVSLDFPAALESFQRAVAEDSTFAKAHLGVAWAGWWLGQDVERGLAAAIRHASGLPARERRLLLAHRHFFRGEDAEAERLYREILTAYPGDLDALYPLGELLVHYSFRHGESYVVAARDVLDRVLRYQPNHGEALFHRTHLAAHEGDLTALDTLSARAIALPHGNTAEVALMRALRAFMLKGPDSAAEREQVLGDLRTADDFSILISGYGLGSIAGDFGAARRALGFLTQPGRDTRARAAGHAMLALLDLVEGRWRDAMAGLDVVERLDPPTALLFRGHFALVPFRPMSTAERGRLRDQLEGWAPRHDTNAVGTLPSFIWLPGSVHLPARDYFLGLMDAQEARPEMARRRAAPLDTLKEPGGTLGTDLAAAVRAEIARAAGDAQGALDELEKMRHRSPFAELAASPLHLRTRERYLRAELLIQLGRDDEAFGWLESIEQDFNMFDILYLAPALLRKAEILERRGDRAGAAESYARVLELWERCDPEFEPIRDVAARGIERLDAGYFRGEAPLRDSRLEDDRWFTEAEIQIWANTDSIEVRGLGPVGSGQSARRLTFRGSD